MKISRPASDRRIPSGQRWTDSDQRKDCPTECHIGRRAIGPERIDAQDFAEQNPTILGVAEVISRPGSDGTAACVADVVVIGTAPVAAADVEEAVRAEFKLTAIMVCLRLGKDEQPSLGRKDCHVRIRQ